jgi:transcription antitermination factor NusG
VLRIFGSDALAPTPLPIGFVEELRERPAETLDRMNERAGFLVDDVCRVTNGPFTGLSGVCVRSAALRVTLLLTLLGKPRPIGVPIEDVALA